jgi:putative hydrolase of the HAD superfamily
VIRAILFDLDGTLAHFTGDYGLFVAGFRSDLGLEACDMNTFATRLAAEERREGPGTVRRSLETVLRGLEQRVPDDLDALSERSIADYCAQMALLPGAREVLELCRAHDLPLALVTNAHADGQWAVVRALDLEPYFKRVLISGDEGVAVRKPNPRIFELALGAVGTLPEETLMVGDNLEADIRGALACGLQAVYLGTETGTGFTTLPDIQAFGEWLEAHLAE